MNQESSTTRHTYCQEMVDKSYYQYGLIAHCPSGKDMLRASSSMLAVSEYSPISASALERRQHSSPSHFYRISGDYYASNVSVTTPNIAWYQLLLSYYDPEEQPNVLQYRVSLVESHQQKDSMCNYSRSSL